MTSTTATADYQATAQLLQDKTILVTGAGDGIGRAAALAYAAHGATVLLLGRTGSKLEAVYDEIEAQGGARPGLIELDLATASEDNFHHLASGLAEEFNHLDGLLHNASLLGPKVNVAHYPTDEWQKVFQVSVQRCVLKSVEIIKNE